MARMPDTVYFTVAALTEKRLAAALAAVGPGAIEEMAWSPFAIPVRYVGDPDDNVQAEEPYPMASLAAAIMRALDVLPDAVPDITVGPC